jgi:hypothetical protein
VGISGIGAAPFVEVVVFDGEDSGLRGVTSGSGVSAFPLLFFRWNLFLLYVSPFAVSTT